MDRETRKRLQIYMRRKGINRRRRKIQQYSELLQRESKGII